MICSVICSSKLIFIINVNTKWRACLTYICIFIKGGYGFFVFLNKRGQEVSFWFMIDITSPPPAINNEWSLNYLMFKEEGYNWIT